MANANETLPGPTPAFKAPDVVLFVKIIVFNCGCIATKPITEKKAEWDLVSCNEHSHYVSRAEVILIARSAENVMEALSRDFR